MPRRTENASHHRKTGEVKLADEKGVGLSNRGNLSLLVDDDDDDCLSL